MLGELRQTLQKFFDDYDSEHEAFAISSEGLDHELEGDSLKHIVQESVLDDCAEELGDLGQVDVRVLMQESVLVKEAVKDASVDFLLLNNL